MELRRFGDVVGIRIEGNRPFALHSGQLELAEISDEMFAAMALTNLDEATPYLTLTGSPEVEEELRAWQAEQGDLQVETQPSYINSMTINVTQICNLACHYCAAGGDGTYGDPQSRISLEAALPRVEKFLLRVPCEGEFRFVFLGGEPLLYPQGIRLIGDRALEIAKERQFRVRFHIITNGTLLSEENLNLLAPLRPSFTVSIDGPKEINDRVRPQKDGQSSTDRTLAGLRKLLERKPEFGPVQIHSVFNRHNTGVEAAWETFHHLPVDRMEFTFDILETSTQAQEAYIEEIARVLHAAWLSGGEKEIRRISYIDEVFTRLDGRLGKINHCSSGKGLVSLDSRGQLFACPLDVSHPDRVLKSSSIETGRVESLHKPLIDLNNCQTCWARYFCGGGCMYSHRAHTGDRHRKDKNFCQRTRHLLALALFYYKESRAGG
ncbi:MAG: radical SAM protein [Bdellovibrionaceae bacterium]|nr:radical SAM protein [Pseudobdellovibrionaceae bacterium]